MTDYEWCRDFIEHNCILRSPPGKRLLISKGDLNAWQFYLPIATLDQQFAAKVAAMFWARFADKMPFQVCACESGGIPLLTAIQALYPVSGFVIKKKAKAYGIGNWLEGVVHDDLPVLLIDDVKGYGKTLTAQANRLAGFGLELVDTAFCVVASQKTASPDIKVGEQTVFVDCIFAADDFARMYGEYVGKYGKTPQFHGTLV